ncbi:hypothetical protein ACNVED_02925 [Legionella sp. D16C41]|uniref:hypothetical protein n=1 Tax=Legionella sp. D16C41 TaxID=3402688 RepID=UPI003AF4FBEA
MSVPSTHAKSLLSEADDILVSKVDDVKDFFRQNLPTSTAIEEAKATELLSKLAENYSYEEILRQCFVGDNLQLDLDLFVKSAGFAFSKGKLTREQMSSICEFREMKLGFAALELTKNNVQSFSFLDENNSLTKAL